MDTETERQTDALLAPIYDAVLSPQGFDGFVDAICRWHDLKGAVLVTAHTGTGEVRGWWMHGLAREALERYATRYAAEDVLALHIQRQPIATFCASNLDLQPSDYEGTDFHREYLLPFDIHSACAAVVMREGDWVTQLFLQRGRRQPGFGREELARFGRLVPHLQRALQMRQRFADLQMGRNVLTGGLDMLSMPAILVDEFGRVSHHNRSAAAILEQRCDLWLQDGHLQCRSTASARQLGLEITKAVAASRGHGAEAPGVVLLPRAGQKDLMLLVSPLLAGGPGGALLFAFDPGQVPSVTAGLVQRLFDLSEAEAELAVALCSGLTLEEASAGRGTSTHTARSQLKSIFNKTGTNRQADLISVLLTSPAYFLARQQSGRG